MQDKKRSFDEQCLLHEFNESLGVCMWLDTGYFLEEEGLELVLEFLSLVVRLQEVNNVDPQLVTVIQLDQTLFGVLFCGLVTLPEDQNQGVIYHIPLPQEVDVLLNNREQFPPCLLVQSFHQGQKHALDEVLVLPEAEVLEVSLLHHPSLAVALQVEEESLPLAQIGHQQEDVLPLVALGSRVQTDHCVDGHQNGGLVLLELPVLCEDEAEAFQILGTDDLETVFLGLRECDLVTALPHHLRRHLQPLPELSQQLLHLRPLLHPPQSLLLPDLQLALTGRALTDLELELQGFSLEESASGLHEFAVANRSHDDNNGKTMRWEYQSVREEGSGRTGGRQFLLEGLKAELFIGHLAYFLLEDALLLRGRDGVLRGEGEFTEGLPCLYLPLFGGLQMFDPVLLVNDLLELMLKIVDFHSQSMRFLTQSLYLPFTLDCRLNHLLFLDLGLFLHFNESFVLPLYALALIAQVFSMPIRYFPRFPERVRERIVISLHLCQFLHV